MMHTDFLQRQIDFILRTKENCKYLNINNNKNDVTTLINSSIGMFIYIRENYMDEIDDYVISDELREELFDCVYPVYEDGYIDELSEFCRHLRNSIAHGCFDFESEESNYIGEYHIISKIIFEDYDQNENLTAEIRIPIDLLKQFFDEFSDAMIEIISKYKK